MLVMVESEQSDSPVFVQHAPFLPL